MLFYSCVVQVPKKKENASIKKKIAAIFILVALLASYVTYFFSSQNNSITTPSPEAFKHVEWMNYVPSNISGFQYMNTTALKSFNNLFSSESLISLSEPLLNISIQDIEFLIEIGVTNTALVEVLKTNATFFSQINGILVASNISSISYNNITIYKVHSGQNASTGFFWVAPVNGTLIYCEDTVFGPFAIRNIIDANNDPFFNDDAYKIGYLLVAPSQNYYSFFCINEEANDLKINWDMRCVYGDTSITRKEAFFFSSKEDLNAKYQTVIDQLTSKTGIIQTTDRFLIVTNTYTLAEIRDALIGA